MSLELRPYQSAAVQNLRLGLGKGVKRQILVAPTGAGKTEMGMAVVRGCVAKGRRVVFLCNRVHLVAQASRRFYLAGIRHGVIQGDNTRGIDESVIVASIQTVARRGMPDCDLIIIDEAHTVAGSKDFRMVMFQRSAVPVIGLTATPFSKGLGRHYVELGGALFEATVIAATIPELIADGWLVDCEIYAPSEPDMSGIKATKNAYGELDWSDMEVGKAADKPQLVGDIVSHWMRLSYGLPTVCFAANIAHSRHIVESFRAAGVAAEHIDCYTDDDERHAILARVASGETTVISNVGILAEGWDFPACKTLILARPTRSLIRYIQMAGRVLRPHPGKEVALILDHSGTVSRLGYPTVERETVLDDGKAMDAKPQEREEPLPKKCAACSYVKPPRTLVCPKCGCAAKPQHGIETEAGDLVLHTKKAKNKDKQQVWSELLGVANARGYSDGWCSHKYRAYFGVWPKGLADVSCNPSLEILSWVKSQQIRYAKSREAQRAA